MTISNLFTLLLILLTMSQAKFQFIAKPDPNLQKLLNPVISPRTQWNGGDGAVSSYFNLNGTTYAIWVFGDTILGSVNTSSVRQFAYFIHNSIGLWSSKADQSKQIPLYWQTVDGKPFDALAPTNNSIYYWLTQVLTIQKSDSEVHVYIFSPRVLKDRFLETDGTTIIKCVITPENVNNPKSWKFLHHDVPFDISRQGMDWGTSGNVIVDEQDGKRIYLTGREHTNRKYQVMARMRLEEFEKFDWTKLEYWSVPKNDPNAPPAWRKGKVLGNDANLKLSDIQGLEACPEMSLLYHPVLKKWYTIQFRFGEFEARLFTADKIEGPYFSQTIYKVPPPYSTTKNIIVYAVKSHPQHAQKDEIVFTYNMNVFSEDMKEFLKRFSEWFAFYIPQFIRVKIIPN